MRLFVAAVPGGAFEVSPEDPVSALKAAVAARHEALSEEDVRLVFAGRQLEDGASLADYGLQHESTVHLLGRLAGGALLGKAVKGRSKKGKGKRDKGGSKQSDEERALQERIKRMHENDYLKRLAQAAKNELKAQMAQEQKNSRMNRLKIQNQWRKIMRLAKVESLRKDIEILSQNHERDVDRKDAIIQMLDRDLEEAEEQFQMALRSHLRNVDTLVDLQDSRLLALENEFEGELKALEDEFNAERDEITRQHATEKTELNDIMAAVEVEEREREAEAKQEHEQLREEIKNKNLEDINVLRITLDGIIEELEQHFETAHLSYLQNTDRRTTDFKGLTSKDQELSKDIDIKIRKIDRLHTSLAQWRTKIAQNVRESAERNAALQQEKEAIQGHFQALKGRMNKFRDAQARRLSDLTQNADRCKTSLSDMAELAEKILVQAELARKRETEAEKVTPFAVAQSDEEVAELQAQAEGPAAGGGMGMGMGMGMDGDDEDPERADEAGGAGGAPGSAGGAPAGRPQEVLPTQSCMRDPASGAVVEEWNALNRFYQKHNKVLLDKIAIERERERLQKENNDLQAILKQYLDSISVNEDVMSSANPLLVVNGRVNLNENLPVRRSKIAVVDANHMVHTNRVS